MKKTTLADLRTKKETGKKISMVTAYDYPGARAADEAEMDTILVGDSLGMVVLGYDSTVPVTMEEMIHHIRAVMRGTEHAFVLGDMPFMSYQVGPEQAVANAGRLIKEGGCDAVKLEGGVSMVPMVRAIARVGIPVCAHIGLTPQTATSLSGFRVQGRDAESARELLHAAEELEKAGACMLVLECVPTQVAEMITTRLSIPTIGIGAGPGCDGQVLVFHDVLGLYDRFLPRFVKRYANLGQEVVQALSRYRTELEQGEFPGPEHVFTMREDEVDKL
jgi:3-methyl-2-oxobutanoate hydroxymethyltransferase